MCRRLSKTPRPSNPVELSHEQRAAAKHQPFAAKSEINPGPLFYKEVARAICRILRNW